jgi:hypothetical protein
MENKIKKEMINIKIPKELHKRSEKGILKAKLEMQNNKKKSFEIFPYIAMVAALLILIPLCVTQFYNHTPSTSVKSGEAQKAQVNTKSYVSKMYKVSLSYNKNWKQNTQYDIRFEGKTGFFQMSAISGDVLNIDEVANNEANHILKPYGGSPNVSKMTIQGQEARLIIPSEDQPKEYKHQAELIVMYPNAVTINGNKYSYFVLNADKNDIVEIANSIKFLQTAQNNSTTFPILENLNAQQLAKYYEKNGKTLPFSGSNVTRVSPQNFVQNLTNQTKIKPNGSNFAPQVEVILDEWKGNLNNKSFNFEVYQNQYTKETFVGIVYDQQIKVAYSCQSKVCMVHNFTGNYVTFAVSKKSEKNFSINLATGEVIPFSKRKLNLDLAGIDSSHSSNKVKWIMGLNKKYPFKP